MVALRFTINIINQNLLLNNIILLLCSVNITICFVREKLEMYCYNICAPLKIFIYSIRNMVFSTFALENQVSSRGEREGGSQDLKLGLAFVVAIQPLVCHKVQVHVSVLCVQAFSFLLRQRQGYPGVVSFGLGSAAVINPPSPLLTIVLESMYFCLLPGTNDFPVSICWLQWVCTST